MNGAARYGILLLQHLFLSSTDRVIKRAQLVGAREAGVSPAWFAEIAGREPGLAHTCCYLRTTTTLPEP
jgi:hypothetical protein